MNVKMMWQMVAVVGVLSITNGCIPLALGGAAFSGYYVGHDPRTAVQIADDATITATVKTKYIRDDSISALDINVDSYDGIVTLYGTLPDRDAERRAIELAQETGGVRRVVSKITVSSDYSYNDGYSNYGSDQSSTAGNYDSSDYGSASRNDSTKRWKDL